uniref:FAD pyrophosphorylase n=1 Tax=Pithovirus LCPAC102 TaxID=2506587 RepID=A0A481Z4A3_9VIRU|nr:MAG: phosphoadenosine phosphosulfate reductase family [Pithovirus LCPAC102]
MCDNRNKYDESIKKSFNIISNMLYRYQFNEIAISFNGGKDNMVMYYLIFKYLYKIYGENTLMIMPICIYFKPKYEFTKMKKFINKCKKNLYMNLIIYEEDMKNGLIKLQTEYPKIKCISIGTRRTDPYGSKLSPFKLTDSGWPLYMRVCPILDWTYENIWLFINNTKLPYCSLYDDGYTSISDITNTSKNPFLIYHNKYNELSYYPAWKLKDEKNERAGRNKIII